MTDYLPVRKLIWDAWNLDHIKKHGIARSDIEELLEGQRRLVMIETYKGRLKVFGPIVAERILTVVIGPDRNREAGTFYVFSARAAHRSERRMYYEQMEESPDDE
ncbi:MAG: hypothetical protein M3464_06995 [Chloroflexota bacterium]|nr:hypothetical protein [Chloroflexota bacterium]